MKRRLIYLTAALLAGGLLLAGCGSGSKASDADSSGRSDPVSEESTEDGGTEETAGSAREEGVSLTSFIAEDAEGYPVSEVIFEDYDVTMVNCWMTWCGYCILEMPELEELYEELPENVNLVGICFDGADEPESCRKAIEENGVTYMNIMGNDELDRKAGQYLTGYPATFFVNAQGEVIGEALIGYPKRGKQAYLELIQEALDSL